MATNPDFNSNTVNEHEPATAERHQLRLAHLNDRDIPREVAGEIMRGAEETSLVLRVGRQVPVGYGETVVRVPGTDPEVGQVGAGTRVEDREGAEKPVSGVTFASKVFRPIKLAAIVTASAEFEQADPDGFAGDLQGKMSRAIGRGVDLAVFHNRDARGGGELLGTTENGAIADTTNTVPVSDDLYGDLLGAYTAVTDSSDYEFTGWAADPRFRAQLFSARDLDGRPVFQSEPSFADSMGSLFGLPVQYGKGVSGRLGASQDTNIRLVGGDFSQLVYGYAAAIDFKRTDVGNIGDINLWQTNQVAYLVEVTFGWLVNDPQAFVKITTEAAGS